MISQLTDCSCTGCYLIFKKNIHNFVSRVLLFAMFMYRVLFDLKKISIILFPGCCSSRRTVKAREVQEGATNGKKPPTLVLFVQKAKYKLQLL